MIILNELINYTYYSFAGLIIFKSRNATYRIYVAHSCNPYSSVIEKVAVRSRSDLLTYRPKQRPSPVHIHECVVSSTSLFHFNL